MMNSGREWDWMDATKRDTEIQIEEILTEANAYSLRAEVILTANTFMKEDHWQNSATMFCIQVLL